MMDGPVSLGTGGFYYASMPYAFQPVQPYPAGTVIPAATTTTVTTAQEQQQLLESLNTPLNRVFKTVFIGGRMALNVQTLRENNIRYVVNCAAELLGPGSPVGWAALQQAGVTIRHVPWTDTSTQRIFPLTPDVYDTLRFIHERVRQQENILVSCVMGISRSSSMVMAYLLLFHRIPFHEALKTLEAGRPIICPNLSFHGQLLQLEADIKTQDLAEAAKSGGQPPPPANTAVQPIQVQPKTENGGAIPPLFPNLPFQQPPAPQFQSAAPEYAYNPATKSYEPTRSQPLEVHEEPVLADPPPKVNAIDVPTRVARPASFARSFPEEYDQPQRGCYSQPPPPLHESEFPPRFSSQPPPPPAPAPNPDRIRARSPSPYRSRATEAAGAADPPPPPPAPRDAPQRIRPADEMPPSYAYVDPRTGYPPPHPSYQPSSFSRPPAPRPLPSQAPFGDEGQRYAPEYLDAYGRPLYEPPPYHSRPGYVHDLRGPQMDREWGGWRAPPQYFYDERGNYLGSSTNMDPNVHPFDLEPTGDGPYHEEEAEAPPQQPPQQQPAPPPPRSFSQQQQQQQQPPSPPPQSQPPMRGRSNVPGAGPGGHPRSRSVMDRVSDQLNDFFDLFSPKPKDKKAQEAAAKAKKDKKKPDSTKKPPLAPSHADPSANAPPTPPPQPYSYATSQPPPDYEYGNAPFYPPPPAPYGAPPVSAAMPQPLMRSASYSDMRGAHGPPPVGVWPPPAAPVTSAYYGWDAARPVAPMATFIM